MLDLDRPKLLAKNSTGQELVFAMNNVNADARGPQRTMARVGGHSDSRGHERWQKVFSSILL